MSNLSVVKSPEAVQLLRCIDHDLDQLVQLRGKCASGKDREELGLSIRKNLLLLAEKAFLSGSQLILEKIREKEREGTCLII